MNECPECGITWQGDEIPDGLMNTGDYPTREKAEEAAASYGWTPDNRVQFKINVIGVEYAYDHPHHYDGPSEWRCTECGARFSSWTGQLLADNEIQSRDGRVIVDYTLGQ